MNDMDYINKQREVRKIKEKIDSIDSITKEDNLTEIATIIDSLGEETKTMLLKMYAYA